MAQAYDGVPRRAPARIARAETDQESTTQVTQRQPTEQASSRPQRWRVRATSA